jgi:hypothetical protein
MRLVGSKLGVEIRYSRETKPLGPGGNGQYADSAMAPLPKRQIFGPKSPIA